MVQLIAKRRICDEPLSDPILPPLLTHTCVIRPLNESMGKQSYQTVSSGLWMKNLKKGKNEYVQTYSFSFVIQG